VRVTINGTTEELPEGETLAGLLDRRGLEPVRVAVERNGRIVPASQYEHTHLAEGDRIEIVTFVAGG